MAVVGGSLGRIGIVDGRAVGVELAPVALLPVADAATLLIGVTSTAILDARHAEVDARLLELLVLLLGVGIFLVVDEHPPVADTEVLTAVVALDILVVGHD